MRIPWIFLVIFDQKPKLLHAVPLSPTSKRCDQLGLNQAETSVGTRLTYALDHPLIKNKHFLYFLVSPMIHQGASEWVTLSEYKKNIPWYLPASVHPSPCCLSGHPSLNRRYAADTTGILPIRLPVLLVFSPYPELDDNASCAHRGYLCRPAGLHRYLGFEPKIHTTESDQRWKQVFSGVGRRQRRQGHSEYGEEHQNMDRGTGAREALGNVCAKL